jgi:CMP/dCMP kinase
MDNQITQNIIAIDGPAGSGKSTVAVQLAHKLGYLHLNTGAMYRALTLKALKNNIAVDDQQKIARLLTDTTISFNKSADSTPKVLLDGEDVTFEIRNAEVARNVSAVSSYPEVRDFMVNLQRQIAHGNKIVTEGRDTTTVVFPDAEHKFYLDADVTVRAQRCLKDFQARGVEMTLEQMVQDLQRRDRIDSTRKIAPLKKSPLATILDTSDLTPEQVVEAILAIL